MTPFNLLKGIACAAAVLASTAGVVAAKDFPTRPVHIVVPFAAGGGNDLLARTIAQGMSEVLHQSFVVENKPGASGTVGVVSVVGSRPDGYTLVMGGSGSMVLRPIVAASSNPYDPYNDLVPVALIASGSPALLVKKSLNVKNVEELVALAKTKTLTIGSAGIGTSMHLTAELFQQEAGVKMTHVPYGGQGPSLNDILAGNIDVVFVDVSIAQPHVESDRIAILAIAGKERASQLPNIPTAAQSGLPNLVMENWYALYAPKGTPEDVVKKLYDATAEAIRRPEIANIIEKSVVMTPRADDGAKLHQQMVEDTTKWKPIAEKAGIIN